jgi:hypothetical protein
MLVSIKNRDGFISFLQYIRDSLHVQTVAFDPPDPDIVPVLEPTSLDQLLAELQGD